MTDLEDIGAQFREAQAAIGTHRILQAKAEVTYAETLRRHHYDHSAPEVQAADAVVRKAVADVEWCKAAMVAAGEAYKGESFEEVVARNEAHRGH